MSEPTEPKWAEKLAECLQLLVVTCMDQKSWEEATALLRDYYFAQDTIKSDPAPITPQKKRSLEWRYSRCLRALAWITEMPGQTGSNIQATAALEALRDCNELHHAETSVSDRGGPDATPNPTPSPQNTLAPCPSWKLIESAPLDGTIIDLWTNGGRYVDCFWGKPDHSCGEAGEYCDSDWHRSEPHWVDGTFQEFLPAMPTHWMHPIKRSGAPYNKIDGAGCDSGDPLDFTKMEIEQGINFLRDALAVAEQKLKDESTALDREMQQVLRSKQVLSVAERDRERLDWLDALKVRMHAHWGGGPRPDDPSYWVNPTASWLISHSVECGTYYYPLELVRMSVREAIDSAMTSLAKTTQ